MLNQLYYSNDDQKKDAAPKGSDGKELDERYKGLDPKVIFV